MTVVDALDDDNVAEMRDGILLITLTVVAPELGHRRMQHVLRGTSSSAGMLPVTRPGRSARRIRGASPALAKA